MLLRATTCLALIPFLLLPASTAPGRPANRVDPAELMRRDVGTWDVAITMFTPSGETTQSKGTETNVMLGDYWLIGSFEGELQGTRFQGSRRTGFDPDDEEFVLSWVDSLSQHPTNQRGTWDEDTRTMTSTGTGKTRFGAEMETRTVTVHGDDGSRTSTMYVSRNGAEAKMLEFRYTRAADDASAAERPSGATK